MVHTQVLWVAATARQRSLGSCRGEVGAHVLSVTTSWVTSMVSTCDRGAAA